MNPERVPAALDRAGVDPDSIPATERLFIDAAEALRSAARAEPRWAWFVPGRIEIFGKHTDYAGGRSLVCAVPRGFAVVASPRQDNRIRVIDARWHESFECTAADAPEAASGWRRYVSVVARRLAADFPGADLGIDLALASSLPRAAGLSSSSAFVVGLALALATRAELETRNEWRTAIGDRLDLAGYLGAVENGLAFKTLPGTTGVGTHGGSEDHTAILTCRPHQVSAYAYVPVRAAGDAVMPAPWRFVVASSGVHADKAGSARDRYNRASLSTRAIAEAWRRETGEPGRTLAELLSAAPNARDALDAVLERTRELDGFTSEELRIRLAHFVAEDARVPLALDAFRRQDHSALAVLSLESQDEADRLLGNQIPETRALAALAREQGAWAASSFGAGFGGSVWALTTSDDAPAFADRWMTAYRQAVPHITGAECFIAQPGPGVVDV